MKRATDEAVGRRNKFKAAERELKSAERVMAKAQRRYNRALGSYLAAIETLEEVAPGVRHDVPKALEAFRTAKNVVPFQRLKAEQK